MLIDDLMYVRQLYHTEVPLAPPSSLKRKQHSDKMLNLTSPLIRGHLLYAYSYVQAYSNLYTVTLFGPNKVAKHPELSSD